MRRWVLPPPWWQDLSLMMAMRCLRIFLVLGLVPFLVTARAGGQEDKRPAVFRGLAERPDGTIETRHLTIRPSSKPATASPGSRLTLLLDVVPKAKMHVYAPEQKDLIPITLTLERNELVRAGPRRLPPSESYFFAPLNETQRVYSRPFRIEQDVRVLDTPAVRRRAGAADATIAITAVLRYQACDDAICYLPQEVPVSWTVPFGP